MGSASPAAFPLTLGDAEVDSHLSAAQAVSAMRAEIVAHANGVTANPVRRRISMGARTLVVTAGTTSTGEFGLRVYETATDGDQLAGLWWPDGRLRAIVTGSELGAARTGAIGAVAVDALARADATRLAILGSGRQAYRQAWAISAVRVLSHVGVYSPTSARRSALAERLSRGLGIRCVAAPSARAAVEGADIVVLATSSGEPVIEAGWIASGSHVTTIGPKTTAAHELPMDLARGAALLVTDSIAQARHYAPDYVLDRARLVSLGSVLTGQVPGRTSQDEITVFGSVGLSGTEVALARMLADNYVSAHPR